MYEREVPPGMANLVEKPLTSKRTKFITISRNKESHISKVGIILDTRPIMKIFLEKLNH